MHFPLHPHRGTVSQLYLSWFLPQRCLGSRAAFGFGVDRCLLSSDQFSQQQLPQPRYLQSELHVWILALLPYMLPTDSACAEPEGGGGQGVRTPPPWKITKI